MENRKRHQVHRLPTEDINPVTVPFLHNGKRIHKHSAGGAFRRCIKEGFTPQHLYLTNDEEIKEGDWVIDEFDDITQYNGFPLEGNERKITASTATLLIEDDGYTDHLPQPSQDFIKAYCEQGGIDEVYVEYERVSAFEQRGLPSRLKINKLKLNPDNTVITHLIEEKMYSKDDMISFAKYAIKNGFGLNHIENLFDKWIKENL